MQKISKTEFKAHALEVMRDIESSGEAIIITDRGKPTLELRRLKSTSADPLELFKNTVIHYEDPFEPIGLEDWDVLNDSD